MNQKNIIFYNNENKLIYFVILKIFLFCIIINNFIKKNNNETALIVKPLKELDFKIMMNSSIDALNNTITLNKEKLLKLLSINVGQNISSVKTIFLSKNTIFENLIMIINKAIYYCEILQCKNIILDNKYYWFIKKKIKFKKMKIIIKKGDINNFEGSGLIIDKTYNLINLSTFFKTDTKIKINIIKKEILTNLPKVITNKSELYIYIKSDYYFQKSNKLYIHPPFCFYQNILNNYNISNIIIISEFKNDPVANKIINEYRNKNITYKALNLKYKISYLSNSYYLVGASSEFLNIIIILNENLIYFWKYEYLEENKVVFNNNKVIIFKMLASKKYKNLLIKSYNIFSDIYFILNFKCENNFTLIK